MADIHSASPEFIYARTEIPEGVLVQEVVRIPLGEVYKVITPEDLPETE